MYMIYLIYNDNMNTSLIVRFSEKYNTYKKSGIALACDKQGRFQTILKLMIYS